ncbi:MAG: hypothetical protein CM15mV5_3100 [uncultured marine virus]|nr:MAG: hypothetical protein CM15mV5_3100 [uncultured marine virus]
MYLNRQLQSLTGGSPNPNAAVVDLDGDSNIEDLVFDQGTFDSSPVAEIVQVSQLMILLQLLVITLLY